MNNQNGTNSDYVYEYTTPQLRTFVEGKGQTTLFFACPNIVGPVAAPTSHCLNDMYLQVVVDHRNACGVPDDIPT